MLYESAKIAIMELSGKIPKKDIDTMLERLDMIKKLELDKDDEELIYTTMVGNFYSNSMFMNSNIQEQSPTKNTELSGIKIALSSNSLRNTEDLSNELDFVMSLQVGRTLFNFLTSNKNINIRDFIDLPDYICNGKKIKLIAPDGESSIISVW